jgi:iron(III) transport system ATP-binding protein
MASLRSIAAERRTMSFLTLQSVSKSYGSVRALDDVDLSVERGGRTAIVGPSGSGKTTLLRIIAGSEALDSGRLTLDGEVLAEGPASLPSYRRRIGIVAQDGALFPHLNVADNVGFGLRRGDLERTARIHDLMAMVDLDAALLRRRPDQLSGGQQQRVALARALAPKPRLMLLDEPFSALDTALRVSTRKATAALLDAAGVTTILVTHDQGEALSFADQVAVMRLGQLPQIGAPRDLYLRPRDPMIAEFLGDAVILPADVADRWAVCAVGRIPVDSDRRQNGAQIMLRPEQISLTPIDRAAPALDDRLEGAIGQIVETDFGGASCTIIVELMSDSVPSNDIGGSSTARRRLALRKSPLDVPAIGTPVRLSVAGDAHVFTDAR